MEMKLMNVVVFAEKYKELIKWYEEALGLEVITKEEGVYNYTELGYNMQPIIGITPSKEIEHSPVNPRNNSLVMQLKVSNIETLFSLVKKKKGNILFGPTQDEKYNFQYGGVSDIEGNQIWVVEEK